MAKDKEPAKIEPFNPFPDAGLKAWKFSHNNCPEFIVHAPDEKTAIKVGLHRIGLTETPHPCRAWPAE